jgi:hypothetical protein
MTTDTAPGTAPGTAAASPAPSAAGEWLPIAAAATQLGRHPRSVERAAASGRIPARRTAEGRLEVFVPIAGAASPQAEPPSIGASRDRDHEVVVMGRDRQAVALAALSTTEKMLAGTLKEAAAARRAAWRGWAAAACLAITGVCTISWISSSTQRERGEMAVQITEAMAAAAAAERLLAAAEAALAIERARADRAIEAAVAAAAPPAPAPGTAPGSARHGARQEETPPAPAPGTAASTPGTPAWWSELLTGYLGG